MPGTDSSAFRDIFLKLLCSNKILGKKSSSLEGWSRYIIVHDPVCFMSQERVPSGLSRQAKLMSGLRFQLDKRKKLFLVLSAKLGGFYGKELNLMVKILLLWLQVGIAFWKFLILCMGIGFETQMLSLWDGECPGRGWKPGGELKAICPSCLSIYGDSLYIYLGLVVGSRDEETAKHDFLAVQELRRMRWEEEFGSPEPFCDDFREGASPHLPAFGVQVLMCCLACYRQQGWRQLIEWLRSLVSVRNNSCWNAFHAGFGWGFGVKLDGAEWFHRTRCSQKVHYSSILHNTENFDENKSSCPCIVSYCMG